MRYKPTRDSFIPKTYQAIVRDKNSDALVYITGDRSAMGFSGKRAKPDFNYRFGTPEKMAEYVKNYFAGIASANATKAEWKAKRNQASKLIVGDILCSSWGYDQTNVEYWEVTAVIGSHTVEVREIAQERQETQFMQGECIPVPGDYVGPAKRCRVQHGDSVKVHSCASAYKVEPTVIAGCKVYSASHWTAYA